MLQKFGKPCLTNDHDFLQKYGLNLTRVNCNAVALHTLFPNCSIGMIIGLQECKGFVIYLISNPYSTVQYIIPFSIQFKDCQLVCPVR